MRILTLLAFLLVGCSSAIKPTRSDKPELGYKSQTIGDLANLPPPPEPVVVAVYKFRDQTGQYKSTTTGQISYSTAVTQGATSMLIQALKEAGNGRWFTVVERENLPALLNERKIIRQTRQAYQAEGQGLPPMVYAPVILDGGIIAYESNLLTGGMGAKYLGIGADTEFQRDTVTASLRAIAVKDGRVLESVETRKTILSYKVDGSVFKFVGLKSLAEGEVGFTSNEPPQMSAQEAIESSVYMMVMEGAKHGLWNFANKEKGKVAMEAYEHEKQIRPTPVYDKSGNIERFEIG